MRRVALLLFAAAGLAGAERTGPYLGIGAGLSGYDDDGRLASVESSNVAQYRVTAGAYINKHFSVELGYAHFNPFEGVNRDGAAVRERFEVVSASALGHYPLAEDRFDLFARFGAGQIFWNESGDSSRKSNAGTVIFGAGAGVRPLPWLTFLAGFDLYRFGMEVDSTRYDMQLGSAYLEVQVQF